MILSADPGLCQGRGGWNLALWSQAKAHPFPRQQLCQLHAPAIFMPLPSAFQGVQDCRLPFARPQTLQTPPQASKATTLTASCPCHLIFRGSRLPFARPQTLQTPPQASKATTLTASCPCHLFFRGFKTAVCPASNPPNPSAGLQGNNSYSYMPLPSVFQGVQDCRLPTLKPSKPLRRPPRQQLLQLHAPAICFSGGSRLPFARPQTLQTLPQASKATTLTATCPCHLFFRGFKTAVLPGLKPSKPLRRPPRQQLLQLHAPAICFSGGSRLPKPSKPSAGFQGNNSYSYMPLPSVFQGVQDCRLPALKPSKPLRRPPRQQLLQLHAPAICFSGGSRLPFARPQTLQTLRRPPRQQQLHAPAICFSGGSRLPSAVCPASNPPNPSAGLQGNNSYSFMPLPSVFQGVQDCRLPGLKPSKPFRRPPRQQLLQLHAPAICFSGGSRLPFARPQTLQTPPQASKATTLTASCPCHLFFRGFKTAVCPPSNPPNPSAGLKGNNSYSYMPLPSVFQEFKTAVCPASNPPNPSAGLQGNNSYSYMPLPSVFQGVQDCRLPGFKRSKPFRRPPRQQLLQLHAPAICFSGGSRLPSAWLQTLQTLPQASKATTLKGTKFRAKIWDVTGLDIDQPPSAQPPRRGVGGTRALAHSICIMDHSPIPYLRLAPENGSSSSKQRSMGSKSKVLPPASTRCWCISSKDSAYKHATGADFL